MSFASLAAWVWATVFSFTGFIMFVVAALVFRHRWKVSQMFLGFMSVPLIGTHNHLTEPQQDSTEADFFA